MSKDNSIEAFELQYAFQQTLEDFYSRNDLFDDYLSVSQAAEYLSVTVNTMYGYVKDRKIKSYRPDKLVYFSKRDLKEFMRRNPRKSQEELDMEAAISVGSLDRLYEGL